LAQSFSRGAPDERLARSSGGCGESRALLGGNGTFPDATRQCLSK
jgi:hypothetical protein